eukprot:15467390-Heterocapsa_arctica.AAC.1
MAQVRLDQFRKAPSPRSPSLLAPTCGVVALEILGGLFSAQACRLAASTATTLSPMSSSEAF